MFRLFLIVHNGIYNMFLYNVNAVRSLNNDSSLMYIIVTTRLQAFMYLGLYIIYKKPISRGLIHQVV